MSELAGFLDRLRAALGPRADGAADADLLARFALGRDEAAFELLVWRYAPMVLRVCRGAVRDRQEAEDACQATFLALARQAGSVGRPGTVAGWLYRVARRTAARAARRSQRLPLTPEANLDSVAAPTATDPAQSEEARILREELDRLPEKHRVPLMLCFFDGLSHAEAARRLGWPAGTVAVRVARAKESLRRRLTRRGLGLPAIAASVGHAFAGETARAASALAAGKAAKVSSGVLTLLNEVSRAMTVTRLFRAAGVLAACALIALGGVWAAGPGGGPMVDNPHAPKGPARAAAQAVPVPDDQDPGDLYFPTKVGTKRVYHVPASGSTYAYDYTDTVSKVEKRGTGFRVTTGREVAAGTLTTVTDVSAKGVYLVEIAGKLHADPLPLLKLPAKAGDSWTAVLQIPAAGPATFIYTVGKVEEVEVPAGKFKAIRVDERTDETNPPMLATRWYAPGVGLVKAITNPGKSETIQVLKSFTPGK